MENTDQGLVVQSSLGWPLAAAVARGPAGVGRRLLPGSGVARASADKARNPELSSAHFTVA